MRIEALDVVLRPRSAWEAVELGAALVRRHAKAIWRPWLWLTLPVFALVNAVCWWLDAMPLALFVMWWLKPVFDRVPLYVLSRAVFGDVPDTRATLRAQWTFGRRWLLPYLTWRRLSPARSLNMPIDMLEGGSGADAGARRAALGGSVYGVAALLTLVFVHFETALLLGQALIAVIFVPNDYIVSSAKSLGPILLTAPRWLELVYNVLVWLGTAVVTPFYVAGGFGLYLNRRTEIEAWDIEIVLRRLRARLTAGASAFVLLVACASMLLAPLQVHAQDAPIAPAPTAPVPPTMPVPVPVIVPAPATPAPSASAPSSTKPAMDPPTLPRVFGTVEDATSLRRAVKGALADPRVAPKRKVQVWEPRDKTKKTPDDDAEMSPFTRAMSNLFGIGGRIVAWALLGLAVLALLLTAPRWLRWMRGAVGRAPRELVAATDTVVDLAAPLPDDVPTAARALWAAGQHRDALALVYRAAVDAMSRRADVVLPPGATESDCLRASRRLPQPADREAFADAVRTWQYAAYAQRMPADAAFESMLGALDTRFGWSRA